MYDAVIAAAALALRMRAACIALGLGACGDVEMTKPPAAFERGVELLAAQSIDVGPYWVQFAAPPLELCRGDYDALGEWRRICEHVGGYVANFHYGFVVIERTACPADGALLHELVHLALYREMHDADAEHKQAAYWNAVRAANAIWRLEVCT